MEIWQSYRNKKGELTMRGILKSDLNNKVNIFLYNNIISFIAKTSDKKSELENFRNKYLKCLLCDKDINYDLEHFKNEYNVKYIGEFLERYEEKGLKNIDDFRAIALGLSDTIQIQTPLMFVGNQLKDFISEIRNKYQKEFDIYLAAALFNLTHNTAERGKILKDILEYHYTNTEDLIFMFTINFGNSLKNDVYELFKRHLSLLLGMKRNLPVYKNEMFFAFIISELYDIIKADKKKDASLLREFCNLYTKKITASKMLKENGYSDKEISYLNYNIPKCIYDYRNIGINLKKLSYEKIAFDYFISSITDKNSLSQYEKDCLEKLLRKNFEIKCNGYYSIKAYLEDSDIKIENNDTYIWLLNLGLSQESKIFNFNILDDKRNEIVIRMTIEQRINYINNLIINTDTQESEKIISAINKLKNLCNLDYINKIIENGCNNKVAFSKLVDTKIIDLNNYIDEPEKISSELINNIRFYISGVRTIEAYNYTNLFIEKYGIVKLTEIFGKSVIDDLTGYSRNNYSYKKLNIAFNIFDKEQIRKIVSWLIEYVYYFDTKNMDEYIFGILIHTNIINYFSKQELRDIYLLYKQDLMYYKNYNLDKLYLYEEELKLLEKERTMRDEAHKTEIKSEYFIRILNEFKTEFNGTFKSISNFFEISKRYLYDDKKNIIYDFIYIIVSNFKNMYKNYSQSELGYLFKLYAEFLKENYISIDEFFEVVEDVKKGEVKND